MLPIKKALQSSIGKKYVMAASGVALLGFIVAHLAGNLTLYAPDGGAAFNLYAKSLHDLGPVLYLAEIGLGAAFLVHAFLAIKLHTETGAARGGKYIAKRQSKGGESKFSFASNNMLYTGFVLLLFLVGHILHFKFGVFSENTMTMVKGEEARDLYALVSSEFKKPLVAGAYILVMLGLGAHLRHAFWSWLQSLGAMAPKYSKPIYAIGLIFAVAVALGFIGIPLWFLADVPGKLQ